MQRFIWSSVVLASMVTSCATIKGDLAATVKRKAAFELGCAEESLTLSELSSGQSHSGLGAATSQKSYGVQGCGKRASYNGFCTNMMGSESCDAIQTSQPSNVK